MRTTLLKVEEILGDNWNGRNLQPFVDMASSIIDQVVTLAFSSRRVSLSTVQQELMERWLAAHYYCTMDPIYISKSTDGASGSFQKKVGNGYDTTDYGKAACDMDPSGALSALGKRQVASGFTARDGHHDRDSDDLNPSPSCNPYKPYGPDNF